MVHAYVALRVNYCNSVFVSASKEVTLTDKLQSVLNSVACLINGQKYQCGLSRLINDKLH